MARTERPQMKPEGRAHRNWGTGRIYRRGRIWWVQTSFRGVKYRESSHSALKADAIRLLRRKLAEIDRGTFAPHRIEKTSFDDLVRIIRADYEQKQNRTWDRVEHSLK